MELDGHSLVGGQPARSRGTRFRATSPLDGSELPTEFVAATTEDVEAAMGSAAECTWQFRSLEADRRARFLDGIATEIEGLGDELLERCHQETGLPHARLQGERARTCTQLRMFADVVREGSWLDARIDTAIPDREPLAKPDVRSMLVPLGPVVVFGASSFPLAFSTAGGDTASALAAGCPVIFKAHPAHPGTCELVARAIVLASAKSFLPSGVFSLLHDPGHEVGLALVKHPRTRAVAFTGSTTGGRALFEAANNRPDPIPCFAEMAGINPVFILPDAARHWSNEIAAGFASSMSLGMGQFCTKPGLLVGAESEGFANLKEKLAEAVRATSPAPLLTAAIHGNFREAADRLEADDGVELLAVSEEESGSGPVQTGPRLYETSAARFLEDASLSEEVFGPSAIVIEAAARDEVLALARSIGGQLTVTVHGTEEDWKDTTDLIETLRDKAGRVVFNGYPNEVEVCPSIQHGGPWPATTDSRFTSVGTAAIRRWVRQVCFQDAPASLLPAELQDGNPCGIRRLVDNRFTDEAIGDDEDD